MHTLSSPPFVGLASGTSIMNLDGDRLTYAEQSGAVVIDQNSVAYLDSDLPELAGLVLTVSVDGMSATQILGVRNQLPGSGPTIEIVDGQITYDSVPVGEATGGEGEPLTITLVTNDKNAVSALLRNLTYEDTGDAPDGAGAQIVIELVHPEMPEPLASAAVLLDVTPADDPPQADADDFDLDAGGTVIGNVKENDFDPDDPDDRSLFQVLSFNVGATYEARAPGAETINTALSGAYGTLTLNDDGTFTYKADKAASIPVGVVATDTFSYAIKAADGALATTTVTFSVTGQPAFAIMNLDGDALTYPERSAPLLLDTGSVATVDGMLTTFDGVALTVSVDTPSGSELFSLLSDDVGPGQINVSVDGAVTYGGLEVGTLVSEPGGPFILIFNADASNAALTAVLHRLAYEDTSEAPVSKGLTIALTRGTAELSTAHVTVTAQPAEDAPVAENDSAVVTIGGSQIGRVTQNDFDPDDWGAVMTVTGFHAGSASTGAQASPGTTIQGTYGALTLNVDGSYTYLANNASSISVGGAEQDVFTYTVTSAAGGEASAQLTIVVENPSQQTLFTFSNFDADALRYGEQSGPVQIDKDVTAASDGVGWNGVKLYATLGLGGQGESISLQNQGAGNGQIGLAGAAVTYSGTTIGTLQRFSGGSFEISFNAGASDAIVTAVLHSIQYENSNEILQSGVRTIALSATLGGQVFGLGTAAFNLEPNDDPLLSADDAYQVAEEAAVSGNVLANDVDPDRPPPLVKNLIIRGAASGTAAPASQEVKGPLAVAGQYGSLMLNPDGTFTYEANRADALIAGETATEVFTYLFRNETGDEATARLVFTVTGANETRIGTSKADVLVGGRGADVLSGLGGKDRLIGGEGKDILKGGKGKDLFVFEAPTAGADTIVDFEVKQDKIQLFGKAFGLRKGKLKADVFYEFKGSKPKAAERDDRILYNQKKGFLYADLDGSGKKKAPILLGIFKNKPDLSANDFFIV